MTIANDVKLTIAREKMLSSPLDFSLNDAQIIEYFLRCLHLCLVVITISNMP